MTSTGQLGILRDYERLLRVGLAGLPRPDVDDIVEEVRSHLIEEIIDGRTPAQAIAAFGEAATVASDIVARRVAPEDGEAVPPASLARRVAAWCADFVVGWGALVVLPVWPMLIVWVQDRFQMTDELKVDLAARFGYESTPFPFALVAAALVLAAWGVYYWRSIRGRSASVGMRMAGIAGMSVGDKRVVVRTDAIAQSEPARIVARAKWYLAPGIGFLGLLTVLVAFYYTIMTVGSLVQPWGGDIEAARQYEDFGRADSVCVAFYDAVVAGDLDSAMTFAEDSQVDAVDALIRRARRDGIKRAVVGMSVDDSSYIMNEFYGEGRPSKAVMLTLTRHDAQRDAATFVTVYRISSIEETAVP